MDLIYTNSARVDQGVLSAYAFDLSFGAEENDFEMTLSADEPVLEFGSLVYIEGTEYGGTIDAIGSATTSETITYKGRTWHGILNSKIIEPPTGQGHLTVHGNAYAVLSLLIIRLGLRDLFTVDEQSSQVEIQGYQFNRYCKAYDGIKAMLAACSAKLTFAWKDRSVQLSAKPIGNYVDSPVDSDTAVLNVERCEKKVNHLICLGKGELANREVLHLYVDQFGRIGDSRFYTGLDEITDAYDNSNAESTDELRNGGIERLTELRDKDTAEISLPATDEATYDIGDIVAASDIKSGITASATVSQKIVNIKNGAVIVEYKIGS